MDISIGIFIVILTVGVLGDQDNQDIACIDDSDCVHLGRKYSCFLYYCHNWVDTSLTHPQCQADWQCNERLGVNNTDEYKCFRHWNLREVDHGVCFTKYQVTTCDTASDCRGDDKCCGMYCCSDYYYRQWQAFSCFSDMQCKSWKTGQYCCNNNLCCDDRKVEIQRIAEQAMQNLQTASEQDLNQQKNMILNAGLNILGNLTTNLEKTMVDEDETGDEDEANEDDGKEKEDDSDDDDAEKNDEGSDESPVVTEMTETADENALNATNLEEDASDDSASDSDDAEVVTKVSGDDSVPDAATEAKAEADTVDETAADNEKEDDSLDEDDKELVKMIAGLVPTDIFDDGDEDKSEETAESVSEAGNATQVDITNNEIPDIDKVIDKDSSDSSSFSTTNVTNIVYDKTADDNFLKKAYDAAMKPTDDDKTAVGTNDNDDEAAAETADNKGGVAVDTATAQDSVVESPTVDAAAVPADGVSDTSVTAADDEGSMSMENETVKVPPPPPQQTPKKDQEEEEDGQGAGDEEKKDDHVEIEVLADLSGAPSEEKDNSSSEEAGDNAEGKEEAEDVAAEAEVENEINGAEDEKFQYVEPSVFTDDDFSSNGHLEENSEAESSESNANPANSFITTESVDSDNIGISEVELSTEGSKFTIAASPESRSVHVITSSTKSSSTTLNRVDVSWRATLLLTSIGLLRQLREL